MGSQAKPIRFECDKTQQFAVTSKLSEKAIEWFILGNAANYSDVAIGAESKAEAVELYAKPLVAKGLLKADVPGDTIAVKKLWILCNDQYVLDRKPNSGAATDEDAVIPLHEEISIKAGWTTRHNYELPDAHLMVANSLGKLWRDYGANPPHISVWLAETIRTRSNIKPVNGLRMSVVAGKTPVAEEVIVDAVDAAFELFKRIRAFFMSLTFVSILTPAWFPLQSAIMASEQIFTYVTATYNGRTPPIAFLVEAWAHTSHYFSEAMRMGQKRTAAEIIGNLGAWENTWKWNPPAAVCDNSASYGSSQAQPDNKALQQQLESVKGQLKKFQQQADREATAKHQYQQGGNGNPAKKQKGDGKGKGSGQAQWQGSTKPWLQPRSGAKKRNNRQ